MKPLHTLLFFLTFCVATSASAQLPVNINHYSDVFKRVVADSALVLPNDDDSVKLTGRYGTRNALYGGDTVLRMWSPTLQRLVTIGAGGTFIPTSWGTIPGNIQLQTDLMTLINAREVPLTFLASTGIKRAINTVYIDTNLIATQKFVLQQLAAIGQSPEKYIASFIVTGTTNKGLYGVYNDGSTTPVATFADLMGGSGDGPAALAGVDTIYRAGVDLKYTKNGLLYTISGAFSGGTSDTPYFYISEDFDVSEGTQVQPGDTLKLSAARRAVFDTLEQYAGNLVDSVVITGTGTNKQACTYYASGRVVCKPWLDYAVFGGSGGGRTYYNGYGLLKPNDSTFVLDSANIVTKAYGNAAYYPRYANPNNYLTAESDPLRLDSMRIKEFTAGLNKVYLYYHSGRVDSTGSFIDDRNAGNGSVASITMNGPGLLYNAPTIFTGVNGAWTATPSLKTQTAKTFLAGPVSGSDAVPTMRTIVNTDIATGTATAGYVPVSNGDGTSSWAAQTGSGSTVNMDSVIKNINPYNATGQENKNLWVKRTRQNVPVIDSFARLTPQTTNPASSNAGDLWYNSTTPAFHGNVSGTVKQFLMAGEIGMGGIIYVEILNSNATNTRTGLSKYSIERPFLSISAALAAASGTDIVWVRSGTYAETASIPLTVTRLIFENVTLTSSVAGYVFTATPANTTTNYYFIGMGGVNTITASSASASGIFGFTTNPGRIYARNMNFTTSTAGILGNFITILDLENCNVNVVGNLLGATGGIAPTYNIVNSTIYSSAGAGLTVGRAQFSHTIRNSTINTYGACFTNNTWTINATGTVTLDRCTFISRNTFAIDDRMHSSAAVVNTMRDCNIEQQAPSVFGYYDAINSQGAQGKWFFLDCSFLTRSGSYAWAKSNTSSTANIEAYDVWTNSGTTFADPSFTQTVQTR